MNRRLSETQERDKFVYKYLLTCLSDYDSGSKWNESNIARQWNQNRVFIGRVLRSVFPESVAKPKSDAKEESIPGLTLEKLVEILAGLDSHWQSKRGASSDNRRPRIITRSEKLAALRKFSQLSLKEQDQLDLHVHTEDLLLQHLLETITDPIHGLEPHDKVSFYKDALKRYQELQYFKAKNEFSCPQTNEEKPRGTGEAVKHDIEKVIKKNIEEAIKKNYEGLDETLRNSKVEKLTQKVRREINRIKFQSGRIQVENKLKEAEDFPGNIIKYLTNSVIENIILSEEFAISLEYFEVERLPTLPLYLSDEARSTFSKEDLKLINPILHEEDQINNIQGLENQVVYKVKLCFSVKKPGDYEYLFRKDFDSSSHTNDSKLEFFEEIIGIGSPITHIIAGLDRVLLEDLDIPELREYLPVAKEIFNKDEVIGANSNEPTLSYTVITLCRKTDIERAIKNKINYREFAAYQEVAYGEYCSFDLVEAAAKAALFARLRAIKNLGVNSLEYRRKLCHKIEEKNVLTEAKSYLDYYPFSLKAMEGYLDDTIFKSKYRDRNANFVFKEFALDKPWSSVAYESHLTITQAYLREGLYRVAKKYLDAIKLHVEKKHLDNLLETKYHLCLFRYYYLTDLSDQEFCSHRDRTTAISEAEKSLKSANTALVKHLEVYDKVGEASQTNFHPFFYYMSRMLAHRAKLHLFTPHYATKSTNDRSHLKEALCLFEKARIYAARDGSTKHYAYWSAYQACCYIMTAYLEPDEASQLGQENCLKWANRLINHAKLCYSYTGKICYQQIKDNGGKITNHKKHDKYYEKYGNINIQVVPLIQEIQSNDRSISSPYDKESHILRLDLSSLKPSNNMYLFGTHSCMLLFSMGMIKLCEQEVNCENIQEAQKLFSYCSVISEDGCTYDNSTEKELYLDRTPNSVEDVESYFKVLYPHRLTQFAALGKTFSTACQVILNLHTSRKTNLTEDDLKRLSDKLLQQITPKMPSNQVLGQERYNGHLDRHFQGIVNYFAQLEHSNLIPSTLQEIRNKLVKDIFKIVRGEIDIRP